MIRRLIQKIRELPPYHISLYIIIPFIFTGFSVLSALVAGNITRYSLEKGAKVHFPAFWPTVLIGLLAFVAGAVLVRLILKPVERFVEQARKLTPLTPSAKATKDRSVDEIKKFETVFDQVASVLSRIESRHFFPQIIGDSIPMRGLLSLIMKVAPTDATVLVLGESGTGKELVATSIHEHSNRSDQPFIKLNCAAIPEELLESELFGHEKGAFTGANAFKPGKFDMAHRGTIFLDEIGDMPLSLQAKILRVLQEKEFYRVGGSRTIKVDVRIIASTNRNLEQMVRDGLFREDLFYRLNVFTLNLPPLRERKEDIPAMVDHFLSRLPDKTLQVSSMALQMMMAHGWPGNVRELQNTIERAAVICDGEFIEPMHLPASITGAFDPNEDQPLPTLAAKASLDERLNEIEKQLIIDALRQTGGVQVRATELLGINQRSLWHRIKKHDIDVKSIKNGNS